MEEIVIPFATYIGDSFTLMHDNARPHTANIVKRYLEEVELEVMDWPACSPDLNPIEQVWDRLGRQTRQRDPAPSTKETLKTALLEEWDRIPQEFIDNLIRSMPRRLGAVIKARGGSTKY